jgi:hypothetical protein
VTRGPTRATSGASIAIVSFGSMVGMLGMVRPRIAASRLAGQSGIARTGPEGSSTYLVSVITKSPALAVLLAGLATKPVAPRNSPVPPMTGQSFDGCVLSPMYGSSVKTS